MLVIAVVAHAPQNARQWPENSLRTFAILAISLRFLLNFLLLGRGLLNIILTTIDFLASLLSSTALPARWSRGLLWGLSWAAVAGIRSLQPCTERAVFGLELVLGHTHELAGTVGAGQSGQVFEFVVVDLSGALDGVRRWGVSGWVTLGSVSKHCQASARYSICFAERGILNGFLWVG